MGQSFKAQILKRGAQAKWWLLAIVGVIAAVLTFGFSQKRYGKKIGEIKARAVADRQRVHEAAARGDDAAILREWRRHRKSTKNGRKK